MSKATQEPISRFAGFGGPWLKKVSKTRGSREPVVNITLDDLVFDFAMRKETGANSGELL